MNASRAEWHEEALKERLCWRLAEVGPEKIRLGLYWPRGGGYCHIWAIWVCAAVKGMVFKQFSLG